MNASIPPKCKQAELWARPVRCCDRRPRKQPRSGVYETRRLFPLRALLGTLPGFGRFLGFFLGHFQGLLSHGFECLNLTNRSNTPPASEGRSDRSNVFSNAARKSRRRSTSST